MDDNPYIVEFDPREFMEVWESMNNELEHIDKEDIPEHYELVRRVVKKLEIADYEHICKDDEE